MVDYQLAVHEERRDPAAHRVESLRRVAISTTQSATLPGPASRTGIQPHGMRAFGCANAPVNRHHRTPYSFRLNESKWTSRINECG